MNQLLFDRSTGNLDPKAFARIQTSQLLHAIQPVPNLQFNGGEKAISNNGDDRSRNRNPTELKLWAHQTGVTALAIDRFDGKM
jgi:DNA excision repair protein ERCC-8